ncbi:MAG: MMPL family transporter [Mycobacteriales bacterium]|nr:MAG: hypothetical protein DLM56_14360 [Pseudonocardiales bacterium]
MSKFATAVTTPAGRRVKWALLLLWVVLTVVVVPLAAKFSGQQKNEATSYLPGKAESTQVLHLQRRYGQTDALPAAVVYIRDVGLTAADRSVVGGDLARIKANGLMAGSVAEATRPGVFGPFASKDGKALELVFPMASADSDKLAKNVASVRTIVGRHDGLSAYVTGPAGQGADSTNAFSGIDGKLLLAAGIVVIVILLVVYRSPVLWIVPLLSAGLSLELAQAVNYLLARHAGLTVNGLSAGILNVIVFGAGTDYALLLIARYREELHRHEDKHEAMRLALTRTAPAIIASGGTVIVALLCLLLSELNSNVGLGTVAAVGVACTLLAMSTLLPAVLVACGRWIFWPFVPRAGTDSHAESSLWSRIGGGVGRRPRVIWMTTTLVLGVLCVGLVSLKASGLTDAQQYPNKPESVRGQELAQVHFPSNSADTADVLGLRSRQSELQAAIAKTPGVSGVTSAAPLGPYVDFGANITAVADTGAAYDTVVALRSAVRSVPGAQAKVGGQTAANYDVIKAAGHDTRQVIPIVLVVVLVVLGLLLRSLVAPFLLIASVVLSFGAALGISAVFFRHVFHFGNADPSFPLFVFIFLVALGIDYNIFLMTRVREEAVQRGTRRGAVVGLTVTGGVITSAGAVLAATFAVLAVLPLVQLIEVGFAVAVGVLLDTCIVRSILVPALTVDVGRRIWWPSKLAQKADAGAMSSIRR